MDINEFKYMIQNDYKNSCKSFEDEADLIKIIQSGVPGAEKARNELITANIYWAGVYAQKFTFSKLEVEDVWSCAIKGLMLSIDSFDATKGVPFHKYAEYKMKSCILEDIGSYGTDYNLSKQIQNELENLRQVCDELLQKNKSEPSVKEIAKKMRITEEEVDYLLSLKSRFSRFDDLVIAKNSDQDTDDESTENDGICINAEDTESTTQDKEASLKSILPPLDYEIFVRSRGLNGFKPMTHAQILQEINEIREQKEQKKITMEDVIIHYNRAEILERCSD